jgi:hypothetical protein
MKPYYGPHPSTTNHSTWRRLVVATVLLELAALITGWSLFALEKGKRCDHELYNEYSNGDMKNDSTLWVENATLPSKVKSVLRQQLVQGAPCVQGFVAGTYLSLWGKSRWDSKSGTQMIEVKASGSDYRLWAPLTSRPFLSSNRNCGMFFSQTLDHKRGWAKDDHAIITLTLIAVNGGIEASGTVRFMIAGHSDFDTGIVTKALDGAAIASGNPTIAAIAAIGHVAAEVANRLMRQIQNWGEHGGRAQFPAIVAHSMNRLVESTRIT